MIAPSGSAMPKRTGTIEEGGLGQGGAEARK
jgi:hypothetical protein